MTEQPTTAPEAVDPAVWDKLAAPFDASWIEKLPKNLKARDDNKGRCEDTPNGRYYSADGHYCNGWHARSVHLDYIGHAGITMRLNSVVGPGGWNLEPVATTDDGLPLMRGGEFWARLTILGVSKVDLAAHFNSTQEAWGDALRRTAMRFGIGTYLWAKSEYAAELAAFRDPAPGEDPAELAQEYADRLAGYTGPVTTLDEVLAHAREHRYAELEVSYRGEPMTFEAAVEVARVALTEAAEAQAADTAHAEAAEAPQEAASGPQEAPQTPEALPVPPSSDAAAQAVEQNNGETPQDAALDLAREALVCRDAETLRTMYRSVPDLRDLNVIGAVGDDDLAAIDAPRDLETLALGALLIAAGKYVERHRAAIRDLGDPLPPATTGGGDDPWAADAGASYDPRD